VSSAGRSLGIGPVAMLDMSRFVKGFSLWPTAVFDYHNRNSSQNRLYYLKIQLNY